MAAPKRNHNALKHGLYARFIPEEIRREFKRMPTDDPDMEVAASRLLTYNALDLYSLQAPFDQRAEAIALAMKGVDTTSRLLTRRKNLQGTDAGFQDLWSAVEAANRMDGLDHDL